MTNNNKFKFPLLFDGGMGTYYPVKSSKPLPECEIANLFDAQTILEIHKEYVNAGAKAIKTNTFQANKRALTAEFDVVENVIKAGIQLAREAVQGTDTIVFGNIGQIGADEITNFEEYKEIISLNDDHFDDRFASKIYDRIDDIKNIISSYRSMFYN